MMTDHEVIQAADHVEAAIEFLMEIDRIAKQNMKIYVPAEELRIHDGEDPHQSHVLSNYSQNQMHTPDFVESSISVGLFTWLQYKHNGKSKHSQNTLLKTETNNSSILLSTNAGSKQISKIMRTEMNMVFEMHKMGTPECDEYLFLKCLEQDDFIMNALMFQYEWRRRYGRNIILRIGKNPVYTCSLIERTARNAYDKYIEYIGNPKNDQSVRTI